jgi:carbon monoxide dehydrogenase subunit G
VVHVRRSFEVSRPASVVVPYLADFDNAVEWDPGTVTCSRIGDGPVEVGARWSNVSHVLGSDTSLDYRLELLEPGRVVLVGSNRTATSTEDIRVTDRPGGALVTYDSRIVLHGLARLASPLMRVAIERLGAKTVLGIQRAVDRL